MEYILFLLDAVTWALRMGAGFIRLNKLCVEMGQFGDILAPGVPRLQGKIIILCIHPRIYW